MPVTTVTMGISGLDGSAPATQVAEDGTGNLSFSVGADPQATLPTTISSTDDGAGPLEENKITPVEPEVRKKSSESLSAQKDEEAKGEAIDQDDSGSERTDSESDHDSDDDWVVQLASDFSSNVLLGAYENRLRKRAEKKKRSKSSYGIKVVEGLVDYMRALEDRMTQMESNLGMEEDGELDGNNKALLSAAKPISDPDIVIETRFFNSAAVLTEDGSYLAHTGAETQEGTFICGTDDQQLIRVLYSKKTHDGRPPNKYADAQDPNPDDIDIVTFGLTSEAITAFFGKHLDSPTTDSRDLIRFGKPFRHVLRNMNSIRGQLKQLEERFGGVTTEIEEHRDPSSASSLPEQVRSLPDDGSAALPFPPPDQSDTHIQEDEREPFERPIALAHFRAFVGFVDKYLGRQIQQYELLREGKASAVAFENLWMLFDSNDMIYCPVRDGSESYCHDISMEDYKPVKRYTPQAYRVVATTGGLPFPKTMAPMFSRNGQIMSNLKMVLATSGMNVDDVQGYKEGVAASNQPIHAMFNKPHRVRESYSEFQVYCFYLDFDGVKYGMVPDVFVFKPYEREMEIRNLQAYPINYALDHNLEERGKSFLHATKISHLQYEGLTVGSNREEINSPVVIDLTQAFQGGPGKYDVDLKVPTFASVSNLWIFDRGLESRELFGPSSCPHRWCYSNDCSKDQYHNYQKSLRNKVDTELRLILEEYEGEKQRDSKDVNRFHETLVNRDLVKLLPGVVPGFALRVRRWVPLRLDKLSPVKQNNEWDKLVLPRGHQRVVQAMVETYTQSLSSSGLAMDLVRGKGAGCIILLHGVPGVGKTSTAECVAAHTKKPLYPITCGDIGYNPGEVEENMTGHFNLAHRWGCVLLLDEADVFLAKRDKQDIQRNGLVSVFLRILEYYSGILFLTTNRVGAIDDAFRSRLHLTLYYPRLTLKQTKNIFRNNFNRIKEINAERTEQGLLPFDYKDQKEDIMDWATASRKKLKWNGRQIRNAFQTVLALTEFDANEAAKKKNKPFASLPVTKKHFKAIAEATEQFNKYLLKTHGKDEEGIARRESIRAVDPPSAEEEESSNSSSSSSSDSDSSESSDEGKSDAEKKDPNSSDESDAPKKSKKKTSKAKSSKKGKGSAKETKTTSSISKKSKNTAAEEAGSEKKAKDKKAKKKADNSDSD
ncbi:hypothetical protein QBC37DRAFT_431008 [Rhypophila decipiens]|uniref:AAA+ ATPase domain-containing protein n=1 Tax=Rhypophila decipiens TaxID=261697 RepID=A0AAN6XY18_9PEZI|nr:hypothetical protein QBC37DRAFT_431008 [Rhypophila decipiens]